MALRLDRAGIVVLLIALAACRGEPVAGTGGAEPASAPEPIEVGVEEFLAAVRAPGARATLVNVWSTTCIPCVEELPDLARLERAYRERGLRLVLVSVDFGPAARRTAAVLTDSGVRFPTYLLQDTIQRLMPALHEEWTGAIPATVILGGSGGARWFREGQATYEELATRVEDALGS